MFINMGFIADGLVLIVAGLASAALLFGFAWWAPLLLAGAWLATHWFLRESAVWHDRNTSEVREAQRHAEYAYRLAVDPPAAKEVRLFGLADFVMERFVARRTLLHELQYRATRLREKPLAWSALLVVGANVAVFWAIGGRRLRGTARPRARGGVRAGRVRRQRDRVRGDELGARRRLGAGRGRRAPPGGHG